MGCSSSIKSREMARQEKYANGETDDKKGCSKMREENGKDELREDNVTADTTVVKKKVSMTEEEFIKIFSAIREKFQKEIQILDKMNDYATENAVSSLHRISTSLYDILEQKRRHCLGDELAKLGFDRLFVKIWNSLHEVDLFSIKESSDAMKCLKKLKVVAWNYTDKSGMLGKALGESGALNLLMGDFVEPHLDLAHLKNNERRYLIKGTLGILHNSIRMCPDNRNLFREANAVELLQKYLASSYLIIKCKALLCLSYILDEEENEHLNSSSGNIKFILGLLESALKSPSHISQNYRFSASEVINGLNRIAINDNNKVRIVECGGLPLYTQLLQPDCTDEELTLTAKGIWTLAFAPENREHIQNEEGLVEALRNLQKNSDNHEVKKACSGALWVIFKSDEPVSKLDEEEKRLEEINNENDGHIMISYQWDVQDRIIKLKDKLKEAGHNVWMDIERIDGDILSAMADAVEKATVVIVCMSQKYKDSSMCRTEATYSFKLQKTIIPLMVEPNYSPDGWLGALLGTTLYFNFCAEDDLEVVISKILEKVQFIMPSSFQVTSLSNPSTTKPEDAPQALVTSWSSDNVHEWLCQNDLEDMSNHFTVYNGEMLIQMKKLSHQAPEFFYKSLKTDVGFQDLYTILKFAKALDKLVI